MNSKISISIVIVGGYLATSFSYWNSNSLLGIDWWEVCQGGWGEGGGGGGRGWRTWGVAPFFNFLGFLAAAFPYWNCNETLPGTPPTNLFPIGNRDFNKKRRWPDTHQRLHKGIAIPIRECCGETLPGTPPTNLFPIGNCDFNKKKGWPDTRQQLQ